MSFFPEAATSYLCWKKGKDPHPQDKIQHLDFTKDPRPLYYKTPPCAFYHKNVRTKLALSETGRFLSKAEILGVGVSSPLSIVDSSGSREPSQQD